MPNPIPPLRPPKRALRWRLLLLVAAALTAFALLATTVAGTLWGGSLVRSKLEQLASGAGLRLQVADVSVSPFGVVRIDDLHLIRPAGGDVISFKIAEASISPLSALGGARRPEKLLVDGLRLDLRVIDGRPHELLDLWRSAGQLVRRGPRTGTDAVATSGTELIVRGQAQLRLEGKGAELLPKGLRVHGIDVHLDPDRGVGRVAALVEGSVQSRLTAQVLPAQGDRPARVEARFKPEFRIALPLPGEAGKLVNALVIAGFGYDRAEGPAIDGLALRHDKSPVVQIGRVHAAMADATVTASDVRFVLPNAAVAKAAAGLGLHKVLGKADLGGTLGAIEVQLVNPLTGELAVTLRDLQLPMPGKRGRFQVASVHMQGRHPPGGKALAGLSELRVHKPELLLAWREALVADLPGGSALYQALEAARWGKAAGLDEDAATDEDAQKGQAASAKAGHKGNKGKRKRRRRRKARVPATQAAIKPLRGILKHVLGAEEALAAGVAGLSQLPRLKLKVDGARIGLLEPAAAQPFAGIGDGKIDLTAQLGDGTRGLSMSAAPFSAEAAWAPGAIEFTSGADGQLKRASWSFGGPGWAGGLAAAVGPLVAGAGSELQMSGEFIPGGAAATPKATMELSCRKLGLQWWRIAPHPIDDINVDLKLQLSADGKAGLLDLQAPEIKLGQARFSAGLTFKDMKNDKIAARLQLAMPKQDCGKVAAALPASLLPNIGVIEAEGEAAWTFELNLPLRKPYKGKLEASLDDETCEVVRFGDLNLAELAGDFSRPVNESGTILEDQLVGPKSEAWVDLAGLPPWVPYAMMATEDAEFYHHKGLRLGLLSRAIKMCADYGRFVYGGSTITQQLVKNLFLTRDKYLARKFEELLIVWHMERNLMAEAKLEEGSDVARATKDRIMELYINVIEFGPQIYSVVRAAKTYFDKSAAELTPLEAAFLAANKPCPKCGHKRFTTQKWTPWWQERMVGIMKRMRKDGIISDEQFVAEAPYVPRFVGWPQTEQQDAEPQVGGVEE